MITTALTSVKERLPRRASGFNQADDQAVYVTVGCYD